MNFKLSLIAAFVAITSLTACGGGTPIPSIPAESPAALTKTDTTVGGGALAASGKAVKVHYTGWLYTTSIATNKGTQFDSSVGKTPLAFTLGTGAVISGFDQGVTGMKVGGKRTIIIPNHLAYGSRDMGPIIKAGADLIFDVELVDVK